MIEAGVVITGAGPVYWHLPLGRTGGSLPDSRLLWDVLWELRREEFLGFAHSHPGGGIPGPSWTDITTFAAIEQGLGRRLIWWITSADNVIRLDWAGPHKYDYSANPLTINAAGHFTKISDEPEWVAKLREYSTGQGT